MNPSAPLDVPLQAAHGHRHTIDVSTPHAPPIRIASFRAPLSKRWSRYWACLDPHAADDGRVDAMPPTEQRNTAVPRDRRRAGPDAEASRRTLSLSPVQQPVRGVNKGRPDDDDDIDMEVRELKRYQERKKRAVDEVIFVGESGGGSGSGGAASSGSASEPTGGTEQRVKRAKAGALEQLRQKTKKRVASPTPTPSPEPAARSRFFTGQESVQQNDSKRSTAAGKAGKAGKGNAASVRRKALVADPSDDEFGLGDDSWMAGVDEAALQAVEAGGRAGTTDLSRIFDDLDRAPSRASGASGASGSKHSPLAWSSSPPPPPQPPAKDIKPVVSPIRVRARLAHEDALVDLTYDERDEIDGGVIDLDKEDARQRAALPEDDADEDDWGDDAFFDNMDFDLAFDMPSQQAAAVASQQAATVAAPAQIFYATDPSKMVDPSMDPSGPIVEPLVMLDHLRADEREFFLTHWKGKDPTGDRVGGHEKQLQQDRQGGQGSTAGGRTSRGRGGSRGGGGGFRKSWRGARGGRGGRR